MTTSLTHPPAQQGGEGFAHRLLAVLYQHRMATTEQLHRLHPDISSRRTLLHILARLRGQQMVDRATLPRPGRSRVWFLTAEAAELAAGWPEVADRARYTPVTATTAALHSAHTLTVLRTHLAFATDAIVRGDEHGPMDWLPEITHRLPDTGDDRLGPDALMYYTVSVPQRTQLRAFVEVDRGLMASERLARKLIAYARFFHRSPTPPPGRRATTDQQTNLPTWQHFYPRYPRVLFVLTGTGPVGWRNRIDDLKAMVSGHPLVSSFAERVPVAAARLETIEEYGARAAVWTALDGRGGDPVSWTEL